MKSVLIMTFNKENDGNLQLQKMNEVEGIRAVPVLRDVNSLLKIIRKIDMTLPYPLFVDYWLTNSCKINLDSYDALICIAHKWSSKILNNLNRNRKYRCINYFWDKVSVSHYPVKKSDFYENWSFDRCDSRDYFMKYNPQFYVDTVKLPNNKIDFDVCFVGSDRSGEWPERTRFVKEVFGLFTSKDISTNFYYVTNDTSESYMHREMLPLDKYLELSGRGMAILELVKPENGWITERVFLALLNKRKLITSTSRKINTRSKNLCQIR